MKFAAAFPLLFSAVSAFTATPTNKPRGATALSAASLNGWEPNESEFCYGLPGTVAPLKDFDPIGFTDGKDLAQIKAYRESEVTHGR